MHAVQPTESTQLGTNGRALSYKWGTPIINIWGTHCRTNGGRVSHPRRAHNLVQIIVCYNYHSAELRVRGLPKMAHWYIWTLAHLYLLFSPIVVQMGDTLSYKWGTPIINIWGRIVVQMGDAAIDTLYSPSCAPLSYRWGTHCRTNGGRCHRRTFPPLLRPLSYKWGMHYRTDGGCCYSAKPREINLGGRA